MQLDNDRQRLRKFLIENTELSRTVAQRIAKEKIISAKKLAGMEVEDPTQIEIQEYIFKHHDDVEKLVDIVIKDLCKKILPEERIWDLLLQFGILSLFLVPPLGALIAAGIRDFCCTQQIPAADVLGAILLSCLLIASAFAVFKKDRTNKNAE